MLERVRLIMFILVAFAKLVGSSLCDDTDGYVRTVGVIESRFKRAMKNDPAEVVAAFDFLEPFLDRCLLMVKGLRSKTVS